MTPGSSERPGEMDARFVESICERLDVRENVRFRGGAFGAWTHRTFPDNACVLSIEFKKFFMDEWTGEPDPVLLEAIREALGSALPSTLRELAGS